MGSVFSEGKISSVRIIHFNVKLGLIAKNETIGSPARYQTRDCKSSAVPRQLNYEVVTQSKVTSSLLW